MIDGANKVSTGHDWVWKGVSIWVVDLRATYSYPEFAKWTRIRQSQAAHSCEGNGICVVDLVGKGIVKRY